MNIGYSGRFGRSVLSGLILLCLHGASWGDVYVKNKLFKGATNGNGAAVRVEAESMLKAMGIKDYQLSGSQIVVKGSALNLEGNLVSLQELTKAVGAKMVVNKDLGTIDVYIGGDEVIQAAPEPVVAAKEPATQKSQSVPGTAKWHTKWEDAAREAKASNRIVFAYVTGSDWCGWCIKLQDEIFSKKAFQDWASKRVVLLKIDLPRYTKLPDDVQAYNKAFQTKYNASTPDVIFLKPDGQEQGVRYGYAHDGPIPVEEWLQRVEKNMRP